MLTWKDVECQQASAINHNWAYRVTPTFGYNPKNKYVAILCEMDERGKLYQSVLGWFATVEEARTVCEKDAKSN